MHEYGVSGHDRAGIGRWLGFASLLLAGALSQAIVIAQNLTGLHSIGGVTIATGAVYFAMHLGFKQYLWRKKFFKLPDLNGSWKVDGKTLNDKGEVTRLWGGVLSIEQNWTEIAIHLKTMNSKSDSYTATFHRQYGRAGIWQLSYSYRNEPGLENSHELNSHRGFCEIQFDSEFGNAAATYFNSFGRKTFGTMQLSKIVND